MTEPETKKYRTIDQRRAEHALQQIVEIKDCNDGYYISYVSALPATIVMNGLGQALLTLKAKEKERKDDSHGFLYKHVTKWLAKQVKELKACENGSNVIQKLMENDQTVYLIAQAEAMAYLNWLKQFSRAYLKEKEGQSE